MTNLESTIVGMFIGICIGILLFLILTNTIPKSNSYNWGYKQGQIDYANGNIKYHLVTRPSTTLWEEINVK